jgi:hypothetical protein
MREPRAQGLVAAPHACTTRIATRVVRAAPGSEQRHCCQLAPASGRPPAPPAGARWASRWHARPLAHPRCPAWGPAAPPPRRGSAAATCPRTSGCRRRTRRRARCRPAPPAARPPAGHAAAAGRAAEAGGAGARRGPAAPGLPSWRSREVPPGVTACVLLLLDPERKRAGCGAGACCSWGGPGTRASLPTARLNQLPAGSVGRCGCGCRPAIQQRGREALGGAGAAAPDRTERLRNEVDGSVSAEGGQAGPRRVRRAGGRAACVGPADPAGAATSARGECWGVRVGRGGAGSGMAHGTVAPHPYSRAVSWTRSGGRARPRSARASDPRALWVAHGPEAVAWGAAARPCSVAWRSGVCESPA